MLFLDPDARGGRGEAAAEGVDAAPEEACVGTFAFFRGLFLPRGFLEVVEVGVSPLALVGLPGVEKGEGLVEDPFSSDSPPVIEAGVDAAAPRGVFLIFLSRGFFFKRAFFSAFFKALATAATGSLARVALAVGFA